MLIISSNSESTKKTNHILEIAVQAPGEFVIIVLNTLIISKITVASQLSYFVYSSYSASFRNKIENKTNKPGK